LLQCRRYFSLVLWLGKVCVEVKCLLASLAYLRRTSWVRLLWSGNAKRIARHYSVAVAILGAILGR